MSHFEVTRLNLNKNHTWRAKPGYKVCVIDRGAIRFDFPESWITEPKDGAVMLHDRKESEESCDLGVSVFRFSTRELAGVDVKELLTHVTTGPDRVVDSKSDIHVIDRGDTTIYWLEQCYTHREYNRVAKFRAAIARGPVMALITMNYWANRAPGLERAWDEVIRTLVLGVWVTDPQAGPSVQ
jgi:hypothetical protein